MLLREIEVHDNEPQTIKQGAIEGLIVWEVVNGLLLLFLPTLRSPYPTINPRFAGKRYA